jgi:hypothetical protein
MKGDVCVCRVSRFQIDARHATTSLSPFSITYDTHPYCTHLPYEEKRDTRNRDTARIWSPCPKISGYVLSLITLSNFSKPLSALTLLPPLPLAILDPGPGAHCYLVPGLGAHHRLDPSIGVCHHVIPSQSMPPSTSSTMPAFHDPGACCCLPQCRPQPLTPPPTRLTPSRRC